MVTLRQRLIKTSRTTKHKTEWCPDLKGCPQRKVICLRVTVRPPKKPNSAKRRIAKVDLRYRGFDSVQLWVYVPGEGSNIDKHSVIMIRGGRVPDLPGIKYRVIRGKFGMMSILTRRRARSKYGTQHPEADLRKNKKLAEYNKHKILPPRPKISLPRWDYPVVIPVAKVGGLHTKKLRTMKIWRSH